MEIMDKCDFKITYGRSTKRHNGEIENWIGIITNRSNTYDNFGTRISYSENDNKILLYKVFDEEEEKDRFKFYYAFPLLKLIEKARKKGITEIILSQFSKINKALNPFFDVVAGENKQWSKFVLNEEKIINVIKMIETVNYHTAVWEIVHISNNILFRTKADYYEIIWNELNQEFVLLKKDKKPNLRTKKIMELNTVNSLDNFLRNNELVENFQPLLMDQIKYMYRQLMEKSSNEISQEDYKNFYNNLELYLPLENIEKSLFYTKMNKKLIYHKRLNYFTFNELIAGSIETEYSGRKIIMGTNEDIKKQIHKFLLEDLKMAITLA